MVTSQSGVWFVNLFINSLEATIHAPDMTETSCTLALSVWLYLEFLESEILVSHTHLKCC